MENLVFERRTGNSSEKKIIPITEIPILSKEDKEDTVSDIKKDKLKKGETDPHWERIDPDKLEDADIYAYYRTYKDKLEPWDTEEREEFMSYTEKVNRYLEEEYGYGNEDARRGDPRNNLHALILNCLVSRGVWKKREEKKKEKEKNKDETIH